jgi:hypothetical protein
MSSKYPHVNYSVIAELERFGTAWESVTDEEVKILCPFHADHVPSCHVSTVKQVFKCQACGQKGDVVTLLAKIGETTRRVMWEDLLKRYGVEDTGAIDATVIERYHAAIWAAKPLLRELYDRGVTNEMIREHRLGYDDGRVTIPVKNEAGVFVNVRKYMPGARGNLKFKNIRGHGQMRLFLPEQLSHDKVIVCGGELKAIVTAALLNKAGFGATSLTGGEANWDERFTDKFAGKSVWVMLDIDEAGMSAAATRCTMLHGVAKETRLVTLPLDINKYPHGDINDWVGKEHATAEMLLKLLQETPEWKPPTYVDWSSRERPRVLEINKAVSAKYVGQRIRVKGVVNAMDVAPYVIPSEVAVVCDKSGKYCAACPVFSIKPDTDGLRKVKVHPESPGLLEMVNASRAAQRSAIMASLGIPDMCDDVTFKPLKHANAEDVRVSPELHISNRSSDRVMQPAICLGHKLELNETYWFTGRMFPHPRTQQSTLLISRYATAQDALSSYKLENADELLAFRPAEWTVAGIQAKLDAIYSDLESNVTRIYQRRNLHLAVDLAYHSALLFSFDDKVTKGWTEVLVIGDSAQGKSETCLQLKAHYGLGEKVECKNASVAGLLGGLQQMGSRWFVSWGVIPTHDKRLVILEELKGASIEVISKLTDMRSSGVAEIPKIEKRKTHARARLIALSNTRSGHQVSSYNFGVEAIRELIGGLEDVRRFDLAIVLSADEVDASQLNTLMRSRPRVEHVFTGQLCKKLILWAWTRTERQVMFDDDAQTLILEEATRLCNAYDESIPLCDRGSMRLKLARLAVALACRTFSADADDETVRVRRCHVEYVSAFIDQQYGSDAFGYLSYSKALRTTQALQDTKLLWTKLLQVPFPQDFAEQLLHNDEIELRDIADWCGWSKDAAVEMLSLLVRKHALRRNRQGYRKTPEFISLLKDLLASDAMKVALRPDHIKEVNDDY